MKGKGKINEKGFLEIERAGKMKIMECRRGGMALIEGDPVSCACGDACPHFREPVLMGTTASLTICDGTSWFFDEFTDER